MNNPYLWGGNLIFSADEQVVGKWEDDKPLYQKTIRLNFSTSSETLFPLTLISNEIDTTSVKFMFGYAMVDGNALTNVSVPCYYTAQAYISIYLSPLDNKIHLVLGIQYRKAGYYGKVTFIYTKITD